MALTTYPYLYYVTSTFGCLMIQKWQNIICDIDYSNNKFSNVHLCRTYSKLPYQKVSGAMLLNRCCMYTGKCILITSLSKALLQIVNNIGKPRA
jgi:hypothetical protein